MWYARIAGMIPRKSQPHMLHCSLFEKARNARIYI